MFERNQLAQPLSLFSSLSGLDVPPAIELTEKRFCLYSEPPNQVKTPVESEGSRKGSPNCHLAIPFSFPAAVLRVFAVLVVVSSRGDGIRTFVTLCREAIAYRSDTLNRSRTEYDQAFFGCLPFLTGASLFAGTVFDFGNNHILTCSATASNRSSPIRWRYRAAISLAFGV